MAKGHWHPVGDAVMIDVGVHPSLALPGTTAAVSNVT